LNDPADKPAKAKTSLADLETFNILVAQYI